MQAPLIFYTALHLAGPDLTPETFRAGLFRFPSGATHPTDLHISWGDHSIWPSVDLFGSDDATQIWWNPNGQGRRRGRQRGHRALGVLTGREALPAGTVAVG